MRRDLLRLFLIAVIAIKTLKKQQVNTSLENNYSPLEPVTFLYLINCLYLHTFIHTKVNKILHLLFILFDIIAVSDYN